MNDDARAQPRMSVALVHGVNATAEYWTKVLDLLESECTTLTLPGCDPESEAQIDYVAAALQDVTDFLLEQVPGTVVVGHSLGAFVVNAAVARSAELRSADLKLVAVCASPEPSSRFRLVRQAVGGTLRFASLPLGRSERTPLDLLWRSDRLLGFFVRATFGDSPAESDLALVTRGVRAASMVASGQYAAWTLRDGHDLLSPGVWAAGSVAVISGRHDRMFTTRSCERAARRLSARHIDVAHAGHHVPLEAPRAVIEAIAAVTGPHR